MKHKIISQIQNLIIENQLKQAIDRITDIARKYSFTDLISEIEIISENYRTMLHYTVLGVEDPERENVYMHLQTKLLNITEKLHIRILKTTNETIPSGIPVVKKYDLDTSMGDELIRNWFYYLLQFNTLTEGEINKLVNILNSDEFKWYDKSLIISGITLSLLSSFDINKIVFLKDIYLIGEEQLWQRALIGLIISFYIHDKLLKKYKVSEKVFNDLRADDKFESRMEYIFLQFIKALETEKVGKKIHEEIIPEMAKITPSIKEKLNLDSIIKENSLEEEENPDWSDFFKDSPGLLDKLTEMSEMQMDGTDIFINTFAQLKNYHFFSKVENWFLPFYVENEEAKTAISNEEGFKSDKFMSGLSKAPFICNSDKYSFCFSISHMPAAQKSMLGHYFNAELDQMREIVEDDELLNKPTVSNKVITQYIQDLYRFFKLHRSKNEFYDIFSWSWNVVNKDFYKNLDLNISVTRKIGEFFFIKGYYQQASEIYNIISKDEPDFEIFQKMGFAEQKQKNYEKALKYYKNAELFNGDQAWNHKKIGFCYRKLNQPQQALEYYKKAEGLEPDNLSTTAAIGHCLLDLAKYEEALKYYFKVEFLAPENKKVMRPLAWCSLVLNKFDQAKKYTEKLIETDELPHDRVVLGHLLWKDNKRKEAISQYVKAVSMKAYSVELFRSTILQDAEILKNLNIKTEEIDFIIDYIRYQI